MWRNAEGRYGLVSIAFHWSVALAFIGLTALGVWMVGLTYYDPWYNDSLAIHKAAGIAVLVLALARLGWRCVDPAPGLVPGLRAWERTGAAVTHWSLAALAVLAPVTGYAISTSEGAGIDMFGLFELPALFAVTGRARDLAVDLHYWFAYGGIALAAVHAGAALKHHFVDRNATLTRMLAPRSPPGGRAGGNRTRGG